MPWKQWTASLDNAFPEAVRLTAYRVVEEALSNVAKHASAAQVDVEVRLDGSQLAIEVRDDGVGFDPRASRHGLGMGAIAARVERIGGTWTIASSPGAGTRLRVRLPLSVEHAQDGFHAEVALRQEAGAQADGSRAVATAL